MSQDLSGSRTDYDTPLRIAIIRTTSIGDVILCTSCLTALEKIPRTLEIVWVGREPSLSLIKKAWPKVEAIPWPSNRASPMGTIIEKRLSQMDLVVDLQTNLRSQRLVKRLSLGGVRVVSAKKFRLTRWSMIFSGRVIGRLLPLRTSLQQAAKMQYESVLDTLRAGLKSLGLPQSQWEGLNGTPSLKHLAGTEESPWRKELSFDHWLAVAPGAAHETKRCPEDVMLEILQMFLHKQKSGECPGLVFVGNEEDRKFAVKLLDSMDWPGRVLNLAGRLSLEATADALSLAKVLLTNDSGLAHAAEAVGTPVAALFGPTVEGFGFPPWRPESRVFSSPIGCRPCSRHGASPCRFGDKLCFRTISTFKVSRFLAECFLSGGG